MLSLTLKQEGKAMNTITENNTNLVAEAEVVEVETTETIEAEVVEVETTETIEAEVAEDDDLQHLNLPAIGENVTTSITSFEVTNDTEALANTEVFELVNDNNNETFKTDNEVFNKMIVNLNNDFVSIRHSIHKAIVNGWILSVKYRNTTYLAQVLNVLKHNSDKGLVKIDKIIYCYKHALGMLASLDTKADSYNVKFAAKSKQPADYVSDLGIVFKYNKHHLNEIKTNPFYTLQKATNEIKIKADFNSAVTAGAKQSALVILDLINNLPEDLEDKGRIAARQAFINEAIKAFSDNLATALMNDKVKDKYAKYLNQHKS